MPTKPSVFAIILAWNQLDLTLGCLDSLKQSDYPNLHLVLVDNGSTDGTPATIAELYPEVEICRLTENKGIAQGYNLGIEQALKLGADYLMVMNNDTLVSPNMVARLVDGFSRHPNTGMLMPKIYHFFGEQNRLWYAGARWRPFPPSIKTIGMDQPDGAQFAEDFELEFAPSCCLLLSRQSVEDVGLFDPGYFFYFDDWDLSARYRSAGYKIYFIADAHLWHKVSVSTQKGAKPERWWQIMGESSVRFYLRHYSSTTLWGHTAWVTLREISKGNRTAVGAFLQGVRSGWRNRTHKN